MGAWKKTTRRKVMRTGASKSAPSSRPPRRQLSSYPLSPHLSVLSLGRRWDQLPPIDSEVHRQRCWPTCRPQGRATGSGPQQGS